ncbi:MAG: hypothetical protein OQK12_18540 [Motiliproteus sp.]|nr:hypothetical protein [Motiliproteus sp.]MCW9053380.1 hypothetical protein [Motiliproteus sp.]
MVIVYIDMDDTICAFSEAAKAQLAANPDIRFPTPRNGCGSNITLAWAFVTA